MLYSPPSSVRTHLCREALDSRSYTEFPTKLHSRAQHEDEVRNKDCSSRINITYDPRPSLAGAAPQAPYAGSAGQAEESLHGVVTHSPAQNMTICCLKFVKIAYFLCVY